MTLQQEVFIQEHGRKLKPGKGGRETKLTILFVGDQISVGSVMGGASRTVDEG